MRKYIALTVGIFATLSAGLVAKGNSGMIGPELSSSQIICNGSFEVGRQNWAFYVRGAPYTEDIKIVALDPQPEVVEDKTAPHGRRVLLWRLPEQAHFHLYSRAYAVQAGDYEVTGFFRVPHPVTFALVRADRASENLLFSQQAPLQDGWVKVRGQVKIAEEVKAIALSVRGQGAGEFRFDGFSVHRAGAERKAGLGVGLAVNTQDDDKIFFASEPKRITFLLFSDVTVRGRLTYRLENAWRQVALSGHRELSLRGGQQKVQPLPLQIRETGHYRLLAQFIGADGAPSPPAELLFAVVPDRQLASEPQEAWESRFGCNMENRPFLMRLARKIGIRWVHCLPPLFTRWSVTEPRPGDWRFYDEQVRAMKDAGLHLVGALIDPPVWATKPGSEEFGGPWPNPNLPTDWTLWRQYVQRVVSHYALYIRHWSVWNEPNHPGYLHLPEGEDWATAYTALLRHTYEAAKSASKEAVILGGMVTHPGGLEPLLQREPLSYADVLGFHWASWSPEGYLRYTGEEMGMLGPKEAVNCLARLLEAMEKGGGKLPLWNTECHITEAEVEREFVTEPPPPKIQQTPSMSALDAAAAIPRQYLNEWAAGVEKTFYWLLAVAESSWEPRSAKTLLEWDRSPTAALVAYAVMTHLLGDAQFQTWEKKTDERLIDRPTFWIFHLRKPDGRHVRVVWSSTDTAHQITLPASSDVKVLDLFGGACPGTKALTGVELKGQVSLLVARAPFYVIDNASGSP